MIKVGLTGNIASGKSEVERILARLGYPVICADEIVHKLYEDNDVKSLILKRFNTLDRGELARLIFSDKEAKKDLEAILHPMVIQKIKEFFSQNGDKTLAFAFVPLIYEMGLEGLFDTVILVTSNDKMREKRLMARDNIDLEFARSKMASQISQEDKVNLADFVIENNGTIKELEGQVTKMLELLPDL